MKAVIDNFSTEAEQYAAFRPDSPDSLYDFLFEHVRNFDTAWDCGTGNGQAAVRLAERFKQVIATDVSEEQIAQAVKKDNIRYLKERAEQTSLPDKSVDVITIAQAIHWFDFEKFYTEVRRVAKPGALVAAWTYTNLKLTPEVNKVLDHLYNEITGPYWDKERRLVDAEYSTIPFPFEELKTPVFSIIKHWTLPQVAGYLRTWSGVKHYVKKEQKDPLLLVWDDLQQAWGTEEKLEVRWPVFMRAGYVK